MAYNIDVNLKVLNIENLKKQIQNTVGNMKVALGTKEAGAGMIAGAVGGGTLAILTGIGGVLSKIFSKMTESSGILKGTLSIFSEAMTLFFKPFADFLGMLLRPLAIILLRFAIWFMKTFKPPQIPNPFGGGGGPFGLGGIGEGMESIQSLGQSIIDDIDNFLNGGGAGGGAGATSGAKEKISKAVKGISDALDIGDKIGNAINKFIDDIRTSLSKINWLETIKSIFENMLNQIALKIYIDLLAWAVILKALFDVFSHILMIVLDTVINSLKQSWDFFFGLLKGLLGGLYNSLKTNLKNLIDAISKAVNWIVTKLPSAVKNALSGIVTLGSDLASIIVSWVRHAVNSATDLLGQAGKLFGFQHGGLVPKTGVYMLHGGERVMPTGASSSEAVVMQPTININAEIQHDYDIHDLAEKISREIYSELRLRTKYGGF